MNPDIITSATHPKAPRSIRTPPRSDSPAEASRPANRDGAGEPAEARASFPRTFRTPGESLRELARATLESVTRTLILSVASISRQRALGALVERHAAAEDVAQQATEVAATAHVLRVRALLSPAEQRLFDDLLRDPAFEQVLAMLVRRSEAESLEILRRQLGTLEPVVSIASLARLIGSLRAGLTNEEYDRIIMRLPHLSPGEQRSLQAHLRTMTPVDAAMLLRGYLLPTCA
jgi:hypothetical protein